MAALAHDVPLLILPLDRRSDQPLVGRAIARSGAGQSISRNSRPARIRAAVEQLLADGPHRAAATRLGSEIRDLDGRRRAADILEKARHE
jgi:UDP:flavonoid glycosyltransferase YjiC (YdhE family)